MMQSSVNNAVGHEGVPLLSVVMPVFNERATIEEIILRVLAVGIEKEIIIVDDFSSDGTREYLANLAELCRRGTAPVPWAQGRFKFVFQDRNYGKGAALRRGFQEAEGEIVVVQDADLELDPRDYRDLIKPICVGQADVVYGSRFLGGKCDGVLSSHLWGNRVLTWASNLCTGLHLTDVWTGYKTFRRKVLFSFDLQEDRFGFEPEFTAKIAARRWRVTEVPVSYKCRTHLEGKKISWKDGFRGLASTVYYGISSRFRLGTEVADLTASISNRKRIVRLVSKQP